MWDILEILFEVVLEAVGSGLSWRSWGSFLAALAVVAGICSLVPNSTLAAVLSIPVVIAGLIVGFVVGR